MPQVLVSGGLVSASSISPHLGNYKSIATATVDSSGATSITFSSIPQTFTHLQLRSFSQFNAAGDVDMQINGDTGANYAYHLTYGAGSGTASTGSTSTTYGHYIGYGNVGNSAFFASVTDILDYTNTNKYKVSRSLFGVDNNGSGFTMINSGLWLNTSAVTSLTIYSKDGKTFQQYTKFALYGIK